MVRTFGVQLIWQVRLGWTPHIGLSVALRPTVGGSVTTIAVIGLGILAWILISILLSLFLARVIRLNRTSISVVEPSPAPQVKKPILRPTVESMAGFPAQPSRFVGRADAMAAATTALAPTSGRTAVVFSGTAGTGKTTCAVELAYRHWHSFGAVAFWSAPT